MIISSPKTSWTMGGMQPVISDSAYVSDTAVVIGDAVIAEEVMVAPGAVIRCDEGMPVFIGHGSNVQDHVVIHGLLEKKIIEGHQRYSVYIGKEVSCGHACVIHGPVCIGDGTFVGFTAVVHSFEVGKHVFIGHGAKVIGVRITDGKYVPHGAVIADQETADRLGPVPDDLVHFNEEVVRVNRELAHGYAEQRKKK